MQLIHVGYGSIVNADRVIAILGADSAPIKRAQSVDKAAALL